MKKSLITFLVFNLVVVFGFWGKSLFEAWPTSAALWAIAWGRLFGLLAVLLVLLQFLLMGRVVWLEKIFGLDALAKIHKKNGQLSLLFILLHPFLITWGYAALGRITYFQQAQLSSQDPKLFFASLSVLLFLIVAGSSIYIVRRRIRYEWWYGVHLLTYIAIAFSWFHQLDYGTDFLANELFTLYWYLIYFFVFGQLLIFRFGRPLWLLWRHQFKVARVESETPVATSVTISGKNMAGLSVKAGQFFILRFLKTPFWWEAHPFSLSKKPDGQDLRFTIKALGDFTRKIPALTTETPVLIEGPFGTFTADRSSTRKVLLVAGGVGITPLRGILEELLEMGKDVIMLYSNSFEKEIIFRKELAGLQKKYNWQLIHIVTQEKVQKMVFGRLDTDRLRELVPDIRQREVFICGAAPMMTAVKKSLQELEVPSDKVYMEEFIL